MSRFLLLLAFAVTPLTHATIEIVSCEPHWAAMAKEIGGDKVKVNNLIEAGIDPHHYEFTKRDIKLVSKADMLVCNGAGLESSWLPELLEKSRNPKLDNGTLFMAAEHVPLLKTRDDHMRGVHPEGNPHVHLNPGLMVRIGRVFKGKLDNLDPANGQYYKEQLLAYTHYLQTGIYKWNKQLASLQSTRVISPHDTWPYLALWLKLDILATVEKIPGFEPSNAELKELQSNLAIMPADLCLKGENEQVFQGQEKIKEITGMKCLELSSTVPDWQEERALVKWYESLMMNIKNATKESLAKQAQNSSGSI